MKLTKENERILRKLGFKPDSELHPKIICMEGWWSLKDGWGFRLDAIKDFKHLVRRLMLTEWERSSWE